MSQITHSIEYTVKTKPRIVSRQITIRELQFCWMNLQSGRTYKTAIGAWNAIRRDAKKFDNCVVVTQVDWETKTRTGAAVVKAIVGNDRVA